MGLDQYLYHIKPVSKTKMKKLYDGIKLEDIPNGITLFEVNKDNQFLYQYIIKYMNELTVMQPTIDKDLIKIANGIDPSSYSLVHYSRVGHYRTYTFVSDDCKEEKTVTVADEDVHKYSKYIPKKYYICEMKECGYWRKDYDLVDIVDEYMNNNDIIVENCGYYPLNLAPGLKEKIMDNYSYGVRNINYKTGVVCYHEWY